MSEQTENLLTGMADAGCKAEEIVKAERILQTGNMRELTRFLRQCRCVLLDRMLFTSICTTAAGRMPFHLISWRVSLQNI